MPSFVNSPGSLLTGFELQGFDCVRKPYNKIESLKPVNVTGEIIAYASPDSTFAVTKKLFDMAKKEILIGIYDFSADYVKELLLNARERKVKVTLMLDINLKAEKELFEQLSVFGCDTVPAPSCQNKVAKYFPNCHEKFIIIDDEWLLVQSGNYSKHSIPFNQEDGGDPKHFKKGNRDMGIAIHSAELAKEFKKILLSDIKLVKDAISLELLTAETVTIPMLVDLVPQLLPDQLFPSKKFIPVKPVKVMPVLSPDNYMEEVTALLSSAKKSIFIENQYIRSAQPEVTKLLDAIGSAIQKTPNLDVRIVLGKIFNAKDVPKEEKNIENLKTRYGLDLGENIRFIDTSRFVHCHNKLIVIDEEVVLISSQNWSDTAVSQNREAGLIIHYPDVAAYYTSIFESDWRTGLKKIPVPGSSTISPQALFGGEYTEVSLADYEEV